MKLKNKKTGEIGEFTATQKIVEDDSLTEHIMPAVRTDNGYRRYSSLAELCKEWEDYKEPKDYWFIGEVGIFKSEKGLFPRIEEYRKEIGGYFETEAEAEKAVEKLKAWKRLKDKRFKFYGWNKGSLLKSKPNTIEFAADDTKIWAWEDIAGDLDLLFGGEDAPTN